MLPAKIVLIGAGSTSFGLDTVAALLKSKRLAGHHYYLAVNLPNRGQIANLPAGALVETPGISSGAGIQPLSVGPLPTAIAELCRRETSVAQLAVDAAVHGDRQAARQCLLLDPVVDDIEAAQAILEDYLVSYRDLLPQFWQ